MHLGPVLACSCVRSDPHPGKPSASRHPAICGATGRSFRRDAYIPPDMPFFARRRAVPRRIVSGQVRHLFGLSGGFRLSVGAAASVSAVSPCGEESLGVRAEESRSVGGEKSFGVEGSGSVDADLNSLGNGRGEPKARKIVADKTKTMMRRSRRPSLTSSQLCSQFFTSVFLTLRSNRLVGSTSLFK